MNRGWLASLLLVGLMGILGSPPAGAEDLDTKRKQYAVVVGVTEYPRLKEVLTPEYCAGRGWIRDFYAERVRLKGPANDTRVWRHVLQSHLGVPSANIKELVGWNPSSSTNPTKKNILRAWREAASRTTTGDRLYFILAGHGSRVWDLDGDEADGKDEVFLAADAALWDEKTAVEGALTDDEIRRELEAIRKKSKAEVVLVVDACHSGTAVRGGTAGFVTRELEPAILGVPPLPPWAKQATTGGAASDSLEKVVALYAAQSYEATPEMAISALGGEIHGLFSFVLCSEIARLGHSIDFAVLHEAVLARYASIPYYGSNPLFEGDLQLPVRGGAKDLSGSRLRLRASKAQLELGVGALAGIIAGTVLSVHALEEPAETVGYVSVKSSGLTSSRCVGIPYQGLPPPEMPAAPKTFLARVAAQPAPDYTLPISAVDVAGLPIAWEHLPQAIKQSLKPTEGSARLERLFPWTSDPNRAAWLIVLTDDGPLLRPRVLGSAQAPSFVVKPEEIASRLLGVFQSENLKRLDHLTHAEGARGPTIEVARKIGTAVDLEGEFVPVDAGEFLQPGTVLRVRITNRTRRAWDTWVFFLSSDFGVQQVWPLGRASPRLTADDTRPQDAGWLLTDSSLGDEQLVVIAVPRSSGDGIVDLSWLATPPLKRLEGEVGGVRTRDAGGRMCDQRNAFALLLEEMATGARLRTGKGLRSGEAIPIGTGEAAPFLKILRFETGWRASSLPAPSREAALFVPDVRDVVSALNRRPARPATGGMHLVGVRGPLAKVYRDVAPSVVLIRTEDGHGTGFLVSKTGLMITNHHIVEHGAAYVRGGWKRVTVARGVMNASGAMRPHATYIPADVLYEDSRRDLALVRLRGQSAWYSKARPLQLAGKSPRPGDECVMIGQPGGALLWTLKAGHVSSVGTIPADVTGVFAAVMGASAAERRRWKQSVIAGKPVLVLQSSCLVAGGDSGGPLVSPDGRILGVTFAGPADPNLDKVAYHVHWKEVKAFLKDATAGLDDKGEPKRGTRPPIPDAWTLGPRVWERSTSRSGGTVDVVITGFSKPEQVLVDVDNDSGIAPGKTKDLEKALRDHAYDAEIALHMGKGWRIAFYDTDNDKSFDLILLDHDADPTADVRFKKTGKTAWSVNPRTSMTWLSTSYLRFLRGASNAAKRRKAVQKLVEALR